MLFSALLLKRTLCITVLSLSLEKKFPEKKCLNESFEAGIILF